MQSPDNPVDAKIYPDAGHAFENPPINMVTDPRTPPLR